MKSFREAALEGARRRGGKEEREGTSFSKAATEAVRQQRETEEREQQTSYGSTSGSPMPPPLVASETRSSSASMQGNTTAIERLDTAHLASPPCTSSRFTEHLQVTDDPTITRMDLIADSWNSRKSLAQRPIGLQYMALSEERLEIRLLSFEPLDTQGSVEDSDLRCNLNTVSLLDRPVYEALSYCWGTTEDLTARIMLDGHNINVSHNLAEALKQLRSEHENAPCLLWVDFVCIDQGNKVEKARQVLLLNRIFARASRVWAWLGPASPQTSFVIHILEDLASSGSLGTNLSEGTQMLLEHAFLPLSRNPYWRRMWIIQELATAETLFLMWGLYKIPWSTFSAASERPDFRRIFQTYNSEALKALRSFRQQEQSVLRTSTRLSLLDALVQCRFSLATEPRDKIYALINMTSDGRDIHPFPNYTQGMDAIIHDIGTAIIGRQQKIAAILLASRSRSITRGLPSWMPNWPALGVDLPSWLVAAVSESSGASWPQDISVHAGALDVSCCFTCPIVSTFPEAFREIMGTPRQSERSTMLSYPQNESQLFEFAHAELCKYPRKNFRDILADLRATSASFKSLWTERDIDIFLKMYKDMIRRMEIAARHPATNIHKDELLVNVIRYWSDTGMQLAYTMFNGSKTSCVVCPQAIIYDQICFLPHCALPVVLRRRGDRWIFIGEALLWFDRPKADVEWENNKETRCQITIK